MNENSAALPICTLKYVNWIGAFGADNFNWINAYVDNFKLINFRLTISKMIGGSAQSVLTILN